MNPAVSKLLVLGAVIVFALTAFGVTIGDLTDREQVAGGLAFGFASFLVP